MSFASSTTIFWRLRSTIWITKVNEDGETCDELTTYTYKVCLFFWSTTQAKHSNSWWNGTPLLQSSSPTARISYIPVFLFYVIEVSDVIKFDALKFIANWYTILCHKVLLLQKTPTVTCPVCWWSDCKLDMQDRCKWWLSLLSFARFHRSLQWWRSPRSPNLSSFMPARYTLNIFDFYSITMRCLTLSNG